MFVSEARQSRFRHPPSTPSRSFAAERPVLELCRDAGKPTRYAVISQSRADLENASNSPSYTIWPYLLASAQTQRFTEISIYTEAGLSSDRMRFLYLNDFALTLWGEMEKPTKVMGRLHRPPRGAVLSFGMPCPD